MIRKIVMGMAALFVLATILAWLQVRPLPSGSPAPAPVSDLQTATPSEPGVRAVPFTEVSTSPSPTPSSTLPDFTRLGVPPPPSGGYPIRGGRGVVLQ